MAILPKILPLSAACVLSLSVFAQQRPPRTPGSPASGGSQRGAGRGPQGQMPPKPDELKKYEDVITKDAKTQTGMFKVHRIDDKVYWEIPVSLLGRDLLWQSELAELPHNVSYPGTVVGLHVIRFERRNNKLFIRDRNFDTRAIGDSGTRAGVAENTVDPIIMALSIEAEGPGKAPVVDVTQIFTGDSLFPAGARFGLSGADPSRSYVDKVKDFPTNIETRSWITFSGGGMPAGMIFGRRFGGGGGASTVLVHYTLAVLPETPMPGRLKDSRIGYFTTRFVEYGHSDNRAMERLYINRFRLEKKDPKSDLSEPVKPIVFYLPKEIPSKWRPYIKAAVEDWQPAFEQAGFKNAIFCKEAPNDPDWDPEDARYNVIRWAPSETENAMGGSMQDPRSGETICAKVIVWNDVVKLLEDWDFAQTAAADPTSRALPFSDEKIGKMLEYVLAHEVGHTLGLEHNFKASVAYSIKELRDPEFMKTHGTAASIMSYSRFDYVAQPGDGVTQFSNRIGPYDVFAIVYGYRPIPGALNADDEKSTLDALLAQQVKDKTLVFGNYLYPGIDPGMQSENISDDPIEAGRLGLRNIDTIATAYLLPFGTKYGDDYTRLDELTTNLQMQRITELLHIVPLIGGVVQNDYHVGHGGEVFVPVPAARQAEAVHFLMTEGMRPPASLFRPEILNRIQPSGTITLVTEQQELLVSDILSSPRIARMQDNEAQNGDKAYTVAQLVTDMSNAVWSDLNSPIPQIDIYRRSLQRSYLSTIDTKINGFIVTSGDLRTLERDDLQRLAKKVDRALPRTKDRVTFAHLKSCRTDIERILDNKYFTQGSGGFDLGAMFGIKASDLAGVSDGEDCWSAYPTIQAAINEVNKDRGQKTQAGG